MTGRTFLLCVIAFGLSPALARASDWRDGAKGYDNGVYEQQHTQLPMLVFVRTGSAESKAFDTSVMKNAKVVAYLDGFVKVTINPEAGTDEDKVAKSLGAKSSPAIVVVLGNGKQTKIATTAKTTPDAFIKSVRAIAGDPGKPAPAKTAAAAAPTPTPRPGPPSEVANAIDPEILRLQDAGKHDEAVTRLTQEIKRAERNGVGASPPLYYARALSYRALHDHARAAEDLEHWVKAHPDDAKAAEILARSYLNVTLYDDAARVLGNLVKDHPTGELYFLLGEADTKRGKADEAKASYSTSCQLGYHAACSK